MAQCGFRLFLRSLKYMSFLFLKKEAEQSSENYDVLAVLQPSSVYDVADFDFFSWNERYFGTPYTR